jgi:hypothetical protein
MASKRPPRVPPQIPPRDPRAAHRRKVVTARRVGVGKKCACGEGRPEALIPGSNPSVCAACQRRSFGSKERDDHHNFGASNSSLTMDVPVNDHRADLSVAQQNWPPATLSNPDESPLLTGAAFIRGFIDTVVYLMKEFLLWVADLLELLDTLLRGKLGEKWWKHTKLEAFETKP